MFLALFTISTILHIIQSFKGKGRYKWMYAMILGGLSKYAFRFSSSLQLFTFFSGTDCFLFLSSSNLSVEILGYGARVWSGHDYESWTQFFVQTC